MNNVSFLTCTKTNFALKSREEIKKNVCKHYIFHICKKTMSGTIGKTDPKFHSNFFSGRVNPFELEGGGHKLHKDGNCFFSQNCKKT